MHSPRDSLHPPDSFYPLVVHLPVFLKRQAVNKYSPPADLFMPVAYERDGRVCSVFTTLMGHTACSSPSVTSSLETVTSSQAFMVVGA